MKKRIRLSESKLRRLVGECVRRVLKEGVYSDRDYYSDATDDEIAADELIDDRRGYSSAYREREPYVYRTCDDSGDYTGYNDEDDIPQWLKDRQNEISWRKRDRWYDDRKGEEMDAMWDEHSLRDSYTDGSVGMAAQDPENPYARHIRNNSHDMKDSFRSGGYGVSPSKIDRVRKDRKGLNPWEGYNGEFY